MSLYQLERDGDLETLTETLERSGNPSIRLRAAQIIGGLFESEDFDDDDLLVGEDTSISTDPELNEADSDRSSVIDVLVSTVTDDSNKKVRAAAIDALDKHGAESLERVIDELSETDLGSAAEWVTAQAYVESLSDNRPELRMAAASGLGRIGDSKATPALVKRLSDPDSRVRARSAVACGRIGDPQAVEALEDRLHDDPSVDVRRGAADALGEIGTEGALSVLLEAADDETVTIRRVVADALGQFGNVTPVDTLVRLLGDDDETVRRTAMFSLVETLSNAPPQQSHDVRNAAADRLGSATADDVIPPLAEILTESSGAPQRRNAAWLLGRVLGDEYEPTARTALVDALSDDDTMTAQFAATSLARLSGPSLESELLELCIDPSAPLEARSKALFVLGKIGGEKTRSELEDLVDSTEHDELREGAFSALSKLGGLGGGGRQ
ncbi:MAG: HEAT repeat domain-containing protein [Natronomonas sp.]|nr:HEAT repeat domain-containing protein [Natronomonas sp.]